MTPKIEFIDCTLRDGHQSIAATRMTTPQALRVLGKINQAGFPCLELWGGAVLDACIRFTHEDPWERLETFRDVLGGGQKIRALLRGQNLFGYRPMPDDLVLAFVKQATASGIGVMRIFDALNDFRNIQVPLVASRAYGARVEAAISYTVSPVHTVEHFVEYAALLEREGADQIAIKDMAGLLHPREALRFFFGALRRQTHLPLVLHCHTTSGVALLNSVLAMQAGLDGIDTCITPFAGGSALPPVEALVVFAEEMGIEHGLDKALLQEIQADLFGLYQELKGTISYGDKYYRPVRFEDIDRGQVQRILALTTRGDEAALDEALVLSRQMLTDLGYPPYDDRIFSSQIPGGMISNLYAQLKELGRPDLLDEVMRAIPEVRRDAGYVPLVTPTSQIIGTQAAFNLMFGPYEMVCDEFKMILKGEFGRTPAPVNPQVVRKVLGAEEEALRYRPAAYLKPVLEDSYRLPFIRTHKDLLLYLMLDKAAEKFLKEKYAEEIAAEEMVVAF